MPSLLAKHLEPAVPPTELRELVRRSVALLGQVLKEQLGIAAFNRIDSLRKSMTLLRKNSLDQTQRVLRQELRKLRRLSQEEQRDFARAFTLMLEIMNTCENAYRSSKIERRLALANEDKPDTLIYVLTAHPTESRHPKNIWIFQKILASLGAILKAPSERDRSLHYETLFHWIQIAWKIRIVRNRKPCVHDEAEHIYSTLLQEEILSTLLYAGQELAPVYIRSWVGGDKDGHPSVDENAFFDSLSLSRRLILVFVMGRLHSVRKTLRQMPTVHLGLDFQKVFTPLRRCRTLRKKDIKGVHLLRKRLKGLAEHYENQVGVLHPALKEILQLMKVFPAFLVPLELRESSSMLRQGGLDAKQAIFRMMKKLSFLSTGGDPRWYVRGLVISMASSLKDIQNAGDLMKQVLGDLPIPIVPLFEQSEALEQAPKIISQMLRDPSFSKVVRKNWENRLEIMVGYSDSSKEVGVYPSRLKIAQAMWQLDALCKRAGTVPIFFQGSGGSVDRGGGTLHDQTAWWPAGALRNYKVTIQGEMVERSLTNPEITLGQLERIVQIAGAWKKREPKSYTPSKVLEAFGDRVKNRYQEMIHSRSFLKVFETATPYRYLDALKIGSRPSQRVQSPSLDQLRAIPWVFCWTQTRLLFPTWWGIGSAWKHCSSFERAQLTQARIHDPLFSTFVHALGYTFAKVEMGVWRIYLEESKLSSEEREEAWNQFIHEYELTKEFVREIQKGKHPLHWRPWLEESISLRSPMIHPLNLLQILAMQRGDTELFRLCVVGISSGMMTTG